MNKFIVNEELENYLIHYVFGRKLTKAERDNFPKSHNAEQVCKYLEGVKQGNEEILDLYSELCQITHPASNSMSTFFVENGNNIIFHNDSDSKIDELLIDNILKSYSKNILKIFFISTVYALVSLKLINYMDIDILKTNDEFLKLIEGGDVWKMCEEELKK